MAKRKVKPTQRDTQASGAKAARNRRDDPRKKSRRGHARLAGGKPRSPSLR
jgi:hypothetical protein